MYIVTTLTVACDMSVVLLQVLRPPPLPKTDRHDITLLKVAINIYFPNIVYIIHTNYQDILKNTKYLHGQHTRITVTRTIISIHLSFIDTLSYVLCIHMSIQIIHPHFCLKCILPSRNIICIYNYSIIRQPYCHHN